MTVQNTKTRIKSKTAINNKTKARSVKKKKGKNIVGKKVNSKILVIIAFFTGVLLIISSYAWLSASLNVKVKFLDLVVSSDKGLFISLDGINFSDSVEISEQNVIEGLLRTYPNNTNQWAAGGLWPVSTNGIKNSNNDKFDMYIGEVIKEKGKTQNKKKYLYTYLTTEDRSNSANIYISFDLFLKNVSGSPKSDNLYLSKDTFVDFDNAVETTDDVKSAMSGIMNSMRIGLLKMSSVSSKADVKTIQNIKCNNMCQSIIFEPNSNLHSEGSITSALAQNITLVDGVYDPTYAVINAGDHLVHANGQEGTGIPLDTAHFALQNTITDFSNPYDTPIFQIPDGITKFRAYVWIEGQDIDSLETNSKGAAIYIAISLEKDLAGYQGY